MTKLPHQISTEDLLNALNEAEDTETTQWENDVPHFLSKFKFEYGENQVKTNLLYKLYYLYSKYPVRQTEFTKTASQFIPKTGDYYSLNVTAMKVARVVNKQTKERSLNVTTSLKVKQHYEKFLLEAGVKKAKTWVEGIILHDIYRRYCIDKKIQYRLAYQNFILLTGLYFDHRRIGSSKAHWFGIDTGLVTRYLTEDDIKRINSRRKKLSEKEREKRRKAQNSYIRRKRLEKKEKTN